MRRFRLPVLFTTVSLIAACATAPRPAVAPLTVAETAAVVPPAPAEPAPLPSLVREVSLPHTSFKLDNGLTVLVHEDHKAPVVGFGVWYNVGSKDEPKGKTGFAHLFEHLMFYGSDNVREGIMPFLQGVGATDWNGTTWFDRTNYYETVPKSNLERVLFMESDRMGYLLPAIDQKRLDAQRGVVQNEKREGDNQPKGRMLEYLQLENLFSEGHPYRHSTIGSMADLDAASLADVKQWFIDKYGPNNAIVSLSGDITPDEARRLMTKYFGTIPAGKVNVPAAADVPTLTAPKSIVFKDQVPTVEFQRHWAVPGIQSEQLAALDLGASVLGGLASSRLDRIMVRDEKIAVQVTANMQPFHRVGFVEITATARPGIDPAVVERRLDQIIAQYLAEGPTQEELDRAATQMVAGRIRGLERVASKNQELAEGLLYNGSSEFYRTQLQQYASVTPAQVRSTMQQWLGRPVLSIKVEPGERAPYVESKGRKPKKAEDIKVPSVKRQMPPLGQPIALDFPDVAHATLSNGIKVAYAQRTAAPLTQVALSFDAGYAADAPGQRGLQNMAVSLLDEGTTTRTSQQIAEEQERLGAVLAANGAADRSTVTLSALSANLAPSLALMADVVRNPAFALAEVERVRSQLVTQVQQAKTTPGTMGQREYMRRIFGASHPYGTTALGDEEALKGLSRENLLQFQQQWLRPDTAELFVVSDRPLAEVQAELERAFGSWQAPAVPAGRKTFTAPPAPPSSPRIVLIDRPGSPQSVIYGGQMTPLDPRSDLTASLAGSDVLGSGTFSRINMDLRETKGWAYSPYSTTVMRAQAVPYLLQANVQQDKTGDSVAALMSLTKDLLGSKRVTPQELGFSVASATGELPGQFETSEAVLAAMQTNALYGRPDNYYELIADRYRALTTAQVDQALSGMINPNALLFVVVGDAAKVRPQLEKLGMPIEVTAAR